ncbi:CPBP family intramembrane glutamic endopeptidase [Kordiimonas aquimaris]|uniref:CPBP family intramembrane glutamic endopeptidase n=1 Tax=Kordiimonas aquimaris TaxID=707591 RepID=UPI0021CF77F6|nr:type II CAAX endopeptidase family protein [Kordiimonas aquimaris]
MNILSQTIFNDEQAQGWLPWGALAPILAFAIIILTLVGTGKLILEPLGFVDSELDHIGPIGLFAMLIVSFGFTGILVILWVKFIERRSLASIGMSAGNCNKTFWYGHGIGMAMMAGIVATIWMLGAYETGTTAPAFASPTSLLYIFMLLIGFGIQSSVEELIFRGWLLSVLTRKFNLLSAIIVSSVLFTLMHFNPANPWYDNILTAVFSLFACAWVIRTGNIWGAMGWHAGWNWFTAVGFELPITGLDTGTPALFVQLKPVGDRLLHGGSTGPEGSLVCMAALVLGTLYLLWQKQMPTASGTTPS